MKPSLVILAAGMGSRYGSLKQIDRFGPSNETILEYGIYDAIDAGFEKVVFVIRKALETEFKKLIGDKISAHVEVKYVYQELGNLPKGFTIPEGRIKPWGTAHAVLMAKGEIDGPFAIINADDFYGAESYTLAYKSLVNMPSGELSMSLIGYVLKKTLSDHGKVSRGICDINKENNLTEIVERTDIFKDGDSIFYLEDDKKTYLTGDEVVSMNLIGFSPEVFALIEKELIKFLEQKENATTKEFFIPEILDIAINQGISVPVIQTMESWFGVTYQQDKEMVKQKLNKLIQASVYPENLWDHAI